MWERCGLGTRGAGVEMMKRDLGSRSIMGPCGRLGTKGGTPNIDALALDSAKEELILP